MKKNIRKIEISAPIPIENQAPIEMRTMNTQMLQKSSEIKPNQVSTMKINMQPVKRSKSFAHKGQILISNKNIKRFTSEVLDAQAFDEGQNRPGNE